MVIKGNPLWECYGDEIVNYDMYNDWIYTGSFKLLKGEKNEKPVLLFFFPFKTTVTVGPVESI